jgi:hypothetical protein
MRSISAGLQRPRAKAKDRSRICTSRASRRAAVSFLESSQSLDGAGRIQDHRRGHHRPGQRAATHLVHTGKPRHSQQALQVHASPTEFK